MDFDNRGGGADTNVTLIINIKRIGNAAGFDGERGDVVVDVINRELVGAAISAVVEGDLPVNCRERGRRRGILRFDPQVVFLQPNGVKAKVFTVATVNTDTGRALDDQIIEKYLIRARGAGCDRKRAGA